MDAQKATEKTIISFADQERCPEDPAGRPHAFRLVRLENGKYSRACVNCKMLAEPKFGDKLHEELPQGVFVDRNDWHVRVVVTENRYETHNGTHLGEQTFIVERINGDRTDIITYEEFQMRYNPAPPLDWDPIVLRKTVLALAMLVVLLALLALGLAVF